MVGKFVFGMLSGGALVAGGFIIGSAMAPLNPPQPANDPAPVTSEAPEAAPAAMPEPAEGAADAVDDSVAEAPATAAAEPTVPAAETEAATVNDSPAASEPAPDAAPEPVVTEQAATVDAAPPLAEPAAEAVVDAPVASADVPALTAPDAPSVAPAPADTAVAEVPAPVQPPVPPATPPVLAQLNPDGVLAALDRSAADAAPVVVAEAAPEPAPEPAADPTPEVAQAEPPVTEPPVLDSGMVAPELEDSATARLPGTAASVMPGNRPTTLPGTGADAGTEAPSAPEVAALPEAVTPAPSLTDAADGVVVGRLPRIGDAPAEPAPEVDTDSVTGSATGDTRPIATFAASFENPDNKPVLAIVLIDQGGADLDRAGLAALPFPVTFALDPLDPATPDRAAIYRAAGKEVAMLATGIAEGAQASDIEVAFQSMEQGLPEAVAVMDLSEAAFQNRRPLASLVVPVVGAQGRGLLTWDQGLNAADQVARREDIAAAVIFRDLTSAGEDGIAIRRILDRAVFKAGQDGRVTVAAAATPETVATLLEWTVEGRAATVAIGPLTAVMTVE